MRPLNAPRLKAAALAICDRRIKACQDAEFRYDAMILAGDSGDLGSPRPSAQTPKSSVRRKSRPGRVCAR